MEQLKRLKDLKNRNGGGRENGQKSVVEKSPTSMKLKSTFILQNNNPSFDNYAAMMRKRKMSATQGTMQSGASMNVAAAKDDDK